MTTPKKTKVAKKSKKFFWRLSKSVWFFPVVLLIPLIGLVSFKLSGSSVGIYHQVIYGQQAPDPDLLYGQPRPIRSDEWLVTSQLTLAQQKAGFPRVNPNLGSGRDLSVIGSIPYKDWSAAFKPENFSFFVLPLAYAFAFKWWVMLYLLIISAYFFTLKMTRNKTFSILFGTAFALSPFVFWWYSTVTLLSLAYGFLILILGMRIINDEPISWLKKRPPVYTKVAYGLGLSYLLMAFGLIFYPPFQIPIVIVASAFLIGHLLNQKFGLGVTNRQLLKRLLVLGVALLLTVILFGAFIFTRSGAIHALTHTDYPGNRVVLSGHMDPLHVFDSFLQSQLQSDKRGANFFTNQSEASNFILLSPFLAIPAIFLSYYEFKKKRRLDWLFVAVQLSVLFFFARVFIPFGSRFYKLFLIGQVPNERLIIGMGFASVLLTLLIINKVNELKIPTKLWFRLVSVYALVCLAVVSWIGFYVLHTYPKFITYPPKVILLATLFCAIIYLLLIKRIVLGAALLLAFSFGCVMKVHPLYRGLGWLGNNKVASLVQADSRPDTTWATADNTLFENFGLIANVDSISGVQPYPDLKLWQRADPSAKTIYNRYAHVVFVSNPQFPTPLYLVQPDLFLVGLTCSKFVTSEVDFVLDTAPINSPCLTLKDKLSYPAIDFYIYKVSP